MAPTRFNYAPRLEKLSKTPTSRGGPLADLASKSSFPQLKGLHGQVDTALWVTLVAVQPQEHQRLPVEQQLPLLPVEALRFDAAQPETHGAGVHLRLQEDYGSLTYPAW